MVDKLTTDSPAMKYIELLTGALTLAGVGAPILFTAVRAAISAFRGADPNLPLPTDAQVIEALKVKALANRDANIAWLRDHGFAD